MSINSDKNLKLRSSKIYQNKVGKIRERVKAKIKKAWKVWLTIKLKVKIKKFDFH